MRRKPARTCADPGKVTVFGTLQTWSRNACRDADGGCRRAMLEVSWRTWEVSPGVFDATAIARAKNDLASYAAAGLTPILGLGLHFVPTWVPATIPDAHFVDNYGATSTTVDFVFNGAVRARAEMFIRRVFAELGTSFIAVRITGGGASELLYPQTLTSTGTRYTWWGFNRAAQAGVNLAPGQVACPLPGARPGTMGSVDAKTWLDWYLGALVNTAAWQMDVATSAGMTGFFHLLLPGCGVRPSAVNSAISRGLPAQHLLGVGAAWETVARLIPYRSRTTLYCTSVGDGSDTSLVQASDDTVPVTGSTANTWGAYRWLARLAGAYGLGLGGENSGWNMPASVNAAYADTSDAGLAASVFRIIAAAPRTGIFNWAHDSYLLADGVSGAGMPASNFFTRIPAAA